LEQLRQIMNRKAWIGIGITMAVMVVAQLVTSCAPRTIPPEPPERMIMAGQTAWPMLAVRDAWQATMAVPPLRPTEDPLYEAGARYPLAWDCNNSWMNAAWPEDGVEHINWDDIDTCFTAARNYTVKLSSGVTISQPIILDLPSQLISAGGAGTSGDPYNDLYLPQWMLDAGYATTFYLGSTNHYYNTIRWGNASFQAEIINFINAAAAEYADDPQLAGVRAYIGFEGETQPNKPGSGSGDTAAAVLLGSETVTSCAAFTTYATAVAEAAYAAFPDHPVWIMVSTNPCSNYNAPALRRDMFNDWHATPTVGIGASIHSLTGDREDADYWKTGYLGRWGSLTTGDTLRTWRVPVFYEFAEEGTGGSIYDDEYGLDRWQYAYWAMLAGAATGGDYLSFNSSWYPFRTTALWELGDHWLQDPNRLWIVFRDLEWGSYAYTTTGAGGRRGDFAKNGAVLTPTAFPQACSQSLTNGMDLRATTIARVTPASTIAPSGPATPAQSERPYPCDGPALPTPKATFQPTPSPNPTSDFNMLQRLANRQGRQLPASKTLGISVDPTWARYGDTADITVRLTYLDSGTDTFALAVNEDSHTITKANTGLWQVASASFTGVSITDADTCADPDRQHRQ
jgi:hypothetical protein